MLQRRHMGIILKTPEEIEQMRVAGQMAGEVLSRRRRLLPSRER